MMVLLFAYFWFQVSSADLPNSRHDGSRILNETETSKIIEKLNRPTINEVRLIETLPHRLDRNPFRFPKMFVQEYSRSQDEREQDAYYRIGFELNKDVERKCVSAKIKIELDVTSYFRYFRDRVNSWQIYGEVAGQEKPTTSRLYVPGKKENDSPLKKSYISYGTDLRRGELELGCFKGVGPHRGLVELKPGPKAHERVSIPFEFEMTAGDISSMRFGLAEVAIPDGDSFMGYIHPRERLTLGERFRVRKIETRLTGGTGFTGKDSEVRPGKSFPIPPNPFEEKNDSKIPTEI